MKSGMTAMSDQSLHFPHEERLSSLLHIECAVKSLIRLGRCHLTGYSCHFVSFVMLQLKREETTGPKKPQDETIQSIPKELAPHSEIGETRIDVYETLCPQQMLVNKGCNIKNWCGECRDVTPTKLQCQNIQRALQVFKKKK